MIERIYVASSWRNALQAAVVAALRRFGIQVYDFKNPKPGNQGFNWREIDADWRHWQPQPFREALDHPIARAGFQLDFEAMTWADACVLVLPCGRSAHLEAGWFAGKGKPVFVLVVDQIEPELMYKLATRVCVNLEELFNAVGAPK
jgi:hypothetical protein